MKIHFALVFLNHSLFIPFTDPSGQPMPHSLQQHFYMAKIPLAGYNVLPALLPADWNVVCGGQNCDIVVLIVMLRMPWQSSFYDEKKPPPRETKYFL